MIWGEEVARHLKAQNVAPVGLNVYYSTIPPRVTSGAMVVPPIEGTPIDHELPGYHRTKMQIIARAKTAAEAEEIAQALSDAIDVEGLQLTGVYFNYIRPYHMPVSYPRSDADLFEASVRFDVSMVVQ
jgi:hypothetical protein